MLQVPDCKTKDKECVDSVAVPFHHEECLNPCEGLYMDVRKTKAESVQEALLELLKERYKNYTSFHEGYNTELKMLKGMLFQHCILLFIVSLPIIVNRSVTETSTSRKCTIQ